VLMGSHTFLLSRKRAVLGAKWGEGVTTRMTDASGPFNRSVQQ